MSLPTPEQVVQAIENAVLWPLELVGIIPQGGGTTTPPQVGSITLSASSTSISTGSNDIFTGVVYDTNNNTMPGQTVYLFENGALIDQTITSPSGTYTFTELFNTAGTYVMDVSDNSSGT